MNLFTTTESDATVVAVDTGDIGEGEIPGELHLRREQLRHPGRRLPDLAEPELLLVVDTYNSIDLRLLTAIGYDGEIETLAFEDVVGKKFRLVFNDDYYTYSDLQRRFTSRRSTTMRSTTIPIRSRSQSSGSPAPPRTAASTVLGEGILYQKELTDIVLADASGSAIALAPEAERMTGVMTGVALTDQTKAAIASSISAPTRSPFRSGSIRSTSMRKPRSRNTSTPTTTARRKPTGSSIPTSPRRSPTPSAPSSMRSPTCSSPSRRSASWCPRS
ncbi:MAG: hypothetical protein MZW92_12285 [Comamonadaceae bacterium]|nr:hypothetical protein [Comamonadaceae bacterium]